MTRQKGYWRTQAEAEIEKVHASLPADTSIEDRKKAIAAAYPFGPRAHHPYKMWLKAQRDYLARFVKSDSQVKTAHLSPLERMMKATNEHQARLQMSGLRYQLPNDR